MKHFFLRILAIAFISIMPFAAHAQSTYLIFKLTNAVQGSSQKLQESTFIRQGEILTLGTYGSYGNGINFQAGIGKMLNPTFGFEITGEFAYGRWHKTDIQEYGDNFELKGYVREKVNTVLIKPVVVIRNSGDLLSFYTKLGIVIAPFIRKYEQLEFSDIEHSTNTSDLLQLNSTEKAKLKIGFTASFGVSFRVSENISLLGEVSGQLMSLPIHKGRYTKAAQNGLDMLPNMDREEKEWVYKESGFFNSPTDPNQPGIRLYNPANYTSIGMSIGIMFYL